MEISLTINFMSNNDGFFFFEKFKLWEVLKKSYDMNKSLNILFYL